MTTNRIISTCPCCGHTKRRYRVIFNSMLLGLLKRIFLHCIERRCHEFSRHDLILSNTAYVNIALLQRFGLIYFLKDENGQKIRGKWGVPMRRVAKFFRDQWKVAKFSWREVGAGHSESSEEEILCSEVKNMPTILDRSTMMPYFIEYDDLERSGVFGKDENQ